MLARKQQLSLSSNGVRKLKEIARSETVPSTQQYTKNAFSEAMRWNFLY
jgi:hypothetical protein